jgi:hypothetical protein
MEKNVAISKRTIALAVASAACLAVLALAATIVHSWSVPRTRDGIFITKSHEPRIQQAYQIAWEERELLAHLPCHCGCLTRPERTHMNVLDCFKTNHAETCGICISTALYAARASVEGRSIDEMKRYLRNVFEFDYKLPAEAAKQ